MVHREENQVPQKQGKHSGLSFKEKWQWLPQTCEQQKQHRVLLRELLSQVTQATAGLRLKGRQQLCLQTVLGQASLGEEVDYLNLRLRTTENKLHFKAPSVTFPQQLA